MTELPQTLDDVRKRIALYQGRDMNEQNTKTALINPVLRALGWDVGNLEEVSQEYKRKPKDKPVDYALFLLRTPKLFVEAKALSQNLDDRKWANQIMGYAAVAGVKWVVLTNGDEYRIYNACVDVPVEDKLFRAIRVTDDHSPAVETLALLSKERIRDNDIEILWKAHFVDRQVRMALEDLFSAEADPSLTRLVKKRVRELSSKDIRASLARLRVRFDFPVEPEPPAGRQGRRRKFAAPFLESKRAGITPKMLGVSLKDLIDAGLLKPPLKIISHYKGANLESDLLPSGVISFQGKECPSLSRAGGVAISTVTDISKPSVDGWHFWKYRDQNGNLVPLDSARRAFLKMNAK